MIATPRPPRPGSAAGRLLGALAARGHRVVGGPEDAGPAAIGAGAGEGRAREPAGRPTLLLCPAPGEPALEGHVRGLPDHREPPAGLLVVTRLGTHPDARDASLKSCWALEEAARATRLPTLTLRLGPMLGPLSPLWMRLRARPGLPRGGRKLLNPVAEEDVVETLHRALSGSVAFEGWYEVAGPGTCSLAEMAGLARDSGPPLPPGTGDWEPPLGEMEEHRLAEAGPWLEHFGMSVRPLAEQARGWAGAAAGSPA